MKIIVNAADNIIIYFILFSEQEIRRHETVTHSPRLHLSDDFHFVSLRCHSCVVVEYFTKTSALLI